MHIHICHFIQFQFHNFMELLHHFCHSAYDSAIAQHEMIYTTILVYIDTRATFAHVATSIIHRPLCTSSSIPLFFVSSVWKLSTTIKLFEGSIIIDHYLCHYSSYKCDERFHNFAFSSVRILSTTTFEYIALNGGNYFVPSWCQSICSRFVYMGILRFYFSRKIVVWRGHYSYVS